MTRPARNHMPGAVFHLTARTQGHRPWFTRRLRGEVVERMAGSVQVSDAELLAYAVMPNHLHLVVRQGKWPLERLMQPMLSGIAVAMHRAHGIEGHVFERRFHDVPCLTPRQARNTIVYAHLNPVRAGLVDDPCLYPWTSHAFYAGGGPGPAAMTDVVEVELGIGLFAARDGASGEDARSGYLDHVDWRLERDRLEESGREETDEEVAASAPPCDGGDLYWDRTFAPLLCSYREPGSRDGGRPAAGLDLGAIAAQTLAELAPGLPLELVRSRFRGAECVAVRRAMVRRMDCAGHSGHAIARYLRVSDQCVSAILVRDRRRRSRLPTA